MMFYKSSLFGGMTCLPDLVVLAGEPELAELVFSRIIVSGVPRAGETGSAAGVGVSLAGETARSRDTHV